MTTQSNHRQFFSEAEKQGLYKSIFNRRDVRGQFKPDPITDEVLSRVLYAAHHAPSVGFMQPWNFVLVRSQRIKQQIHGAFTQANQDAVQKFPPDKTKLYNSLKLEGILESPINVCITCDRSRGGPVVLGRTSQKEMDLYSTVCAVQNFWLAARAEGLGVGWVSIIEPEVLQKTLNLPQEIVPIAYLCVGYVTEFYQEPELQHKGWGKRIPLEELVFFDQWGQPAPEDPLIQQIIADRQISETFK